MCVTSSMGARVEGFGPGVRRGWRCLPALEAALRVTLRGRSQDVGPKPDMAQSPPADSEPGLGRRHPRRTGPPSHDHELARGTVTCRDCARVASLVAAWQPSHAVAWAAR